MQNEVQCNQIQSIVCTTYRSTYLMPNITILFHYNDRKSKATVNNNLDTKPPEWVT